MVAFKVVGRFSDSDSRIAGFQDCYVAKDECGVFTYDSVTSHFVSNHNVPCDLWASAVIDGRVIASSFMAAGSTTPVYVPKCEMMVESRVPLYEGARVSLSDDGTRLYVNRA